MTNFEDKYFQKVDFSGEDIQRHFDSALRDLEIAGEVQFSEVKFSYSYQALLKTGISVIARAGSVRVKSVAGHHIKILEKLSEIAKDPDIFTIGNAMRMKRNADLYTGGQMIAEKEAQEYYLFVKSVVGKVRAWLE